MSVLSLGITRWGVLATCGSFATALAPSPWALDAGGGVWAPTLVPFQSPAAVVAAQPAVDDTDGARLDRPLSPLAAMRAYQTVDQWIRRWETPETAPVISGAAAKDVGGVSIVLRSEGAVIGRSTWMNTGATGSGNELGEMLLAAARAAMGEADRRVKLDNDALRSERMRQVAASMQISLEIAGPLVPVAPKTYDDVERDFTPGLDGVAVRIGDVIVGSFPGVLLSTNINIRLGLARTVAQTTAAIPGGRDDPAIGLAEPAKLVEKYSATIYRFRTVHIAQTEPGAPPRFLLRGSRIVEQSEISTAGLYETADLAAANLLLRAWSGPEAVGLFGTYEPWSDEHDPKIAGPEEQLTAAYALRRYASLKGVAPARALEVRGFAAKLLRDLKSVEPGETAPWDSVVASAVWTAMDGVEADAEGRDASAASAPEECRRKVLGAFNKIDGFSKETPPAARGVVALALVEMAMREPEGVGRAEAEQLAELAVRRAFRAVAAQDVVALMPWLGWAELRLAVLKREKLIPSAIALRAMRETLWKHQVGPLDDAALESKGGLPDTVGGVVFRVPGGVSVSNWQTAQAIAFFPAMLGDVRFTKPDERPLELARLLSSLRYLKQLQADEVIGWMSPNVRSARGGVRSALFDNRMPTDATSMTLLSTTETLRALEAMAASAR